MSEEVVEDEKKDEVKKDESGKDVSEPKDEPKEEPKSDKEEPKTEEPKKESLNEDKGDAKEAEKVEPETKEEPKETKEEPKKVENEPKKDESLMAVISEAKESLSSAVIENETLKKEMLSVKKELESLKSDSKTFKTERESLATELDKFKKAEKLKADEARKTRLESLSVKLKKSGKEVTIESLNKFSDESLIELEKIVGDLTPERLTQPAGTVKVKKESLKKLSSPIRKESLSKPNENFFKGLCETLASEQEESAGGKRVKIM